MFKLLLTAALLGTWALPAWGCMQTNPLEEMRPPLRLPTLPRDRSSIIQPLGEEKVEMAAVTQGRGSWRDSSGQEGMYVYFLSGFNSIKCMACFELGRYYTYTALLDDGRTINFSWSIYPGVSAKPGYRIEITLRSEAERAAGLERREGVVLQVIDKDLDYGISLKHESYEEGIGHNKGRVLLLALPKSITAYAYSPLPRTRTYGIRKLFGLQNGDVLEAINGILVTDTEQAIELLNSLRNESKIEIRVVRDGKPIDLVINVPRDQFTSSPKWLEKPVLDGTNPSP